MTHAFDVIDDNFRTDTQTHRIKQMAGLDLTGATVFDEVQTAEYSPLVAINSTYGLTDYRLITSGNVAEDRGAFRVRSESGQQQSKIETAEHGDYNSGSMAVAGILTWLDALPGGNEEATWGYYDNSNGFQIGYDASGPFLRRRTGGADKAKVRRADWIDPLDGTGDSGITLDWTFPHIWRLRMALYGKGPCEIQVLAEDADDVPVFVTVYRFWADAKELIIESWGLPVRADTDHGGDGTTFDLHVGGMQFGIVGKRLSKARLVPETVIQKSLSGTTEVPVMSVRKKTGEEAKNADTLEIIPLGPDDVIITVYQDTSLTDASFGAFSKVASSETVLELDTSATDFSGGNAIFETSAAGGSGQSGASTAPFELDQVIPNGTIVTITARRVSGTGGTLTLTGLWREGW